MSIDELRGDLIASARRLGQEYVSQPDLKSEQAQEVIEALSISIKAFEAVALIGSTSSSTWYRMNEDLPSGERGDYKQAMHLLKILTALFEPVRA